MNETQIMINFLREFLKDLETNSTTEKQVNKECNFELTLNDIEEKLAQKFEVPLDIMNKILQHLYKINPGAFISLYAKELAVILDLQYPDHITESNTYYVLSLSDGRIHECNTPIKNHECVALFRTIDDAKHACKVLKPILKRVYGQQKNKKH